MSLDRPSIDFLNFAGWPINRIESLFSRITRGTAPAYVERSPVAAIGQRCVTERGFDASKVRPHDAGRMSDVVVPEAGDVLLNSTGTGTIGRSCVFHSPGRFIVDGHVTLLTPKGSVTSSLWFGAVLRSWYGQNFLETRCYSGSTNQVELSARQLGQGTVATPPFREQETIAILLEVVDTLLQRTEQIVAKLKLMKQGLLHDLLTRGIDDNGELRDPDRHPEQFKDSPLGRIPNSWNRGRVGDALRHVIDFRGRTPKKLGMNWGGDIPALSAMNVKMEQIDLSRETYYGNELLYQRWMTSGDPAVGDVLLTMEAPLGNVTQIPDAARYILSQRVILLRFNAALLLNDFAAVQMRGVDFQRRLTAWSTGTTATGIQRAQLVRIPLVMPPAAEQEEIVRQVAKVRGRELEEARVLAKLHLLKQALMDDLLTGRVRVTPLLEGQVSAL